MSGSIGRSYLIQSWNGASEYSGEIIGNRQKESTQLFLKDGKANIAAFADTPAPKKKPIDIRYKICPQQKSYDNLERMQKDLEQQFLGGTLSDEDYLSLSAVLDKKLARAWTLLCRAMQWEDETEIVAYCDDFYPKLEENSWTSKTPACKLSKVERNTIDSGLFDTLNDDNVFKVVWLRVQGLKRFLCHHG